MTKRRIINGQINMADEFEVNEIEVLKSIKFYYAVIDRRQEDFIDRSISSIFDVDPKIEPYEDIDPVFKVYEKDDDGVLFTYGDRKRFDKRLTKVIQNGTEIQTSDLILENYTFVYYQFATNKIAIIYNKSASSWLTSLERFLTINIGNTKIFQVLNSSAYKNLNISDSAEIEYAINNPQVNNEIAFFSTIDTELSETKDMIFEKATVKLTIKLRRDSLKNMVKKINFKQFSKFKVCDSNVVYDLIDETLTLSKKIKLPETLEKGSQNLKILKNEMIYALNYYTD